MLPEAAAVTLAVKSFPPDQDLAIAIDNASVMFVLQSASRHTFWKIYEDHRLAPALREMIAGVHARGARTIFIKTKSHRGNELNESADRLAGLTARDGQLSEQVDYLPNPYYRQHEVKFIRLDSTNTTQLITLDNSPDPLFIEQVLTTLCALSSDTRIIPASDSNTATELRTPGLGHHMRATILQSRSDPWSLTDIAARRLLQGIANSFPSYSQLQKWGIKASAACELCLFPNGTTGHLQCDCPVLDNARTKAHHNIWAQVWDELESLALEKGWTPFFETAIKDIPDLQHSLNQATRRPDGVLRKTVKNVTRVILLDLTRTRGRPANLKEAHDRKITNYADLKLDLSHCNPHHHFAVLPLVAGHVGNMLEEGWLALCREITEDDKDIDHIMMTVTKASCDAFSYMVDMWRIAQQEQSRNHVPRGGLVVAT
jgi:hypothetical protein